MTEIGDMWRDYAYKSARVFKKRQGEQYSYNDLADVLEKIAILEKQFFFELKSVVD